MGLVIIIISYLLGSIPTAYIASHLIKGKDIRQMGDTNMGAANAYRELGARTGITVGVVDAAKGALSIALADRAELSHVLVLSCGLAAVIGHNWPIFLGFRGGRGVSTSIGVLLTTVTWPILIKADRVQSAAAMSGGNRTFLAGEACSSGLASLARVRCAQGLQRYSSRL
jgi:acyl phosphate:glycerol-3-phosphate acyltransferase